MEWTPIVDCAYDATITVAAEASEAVIVTIQLKDFEGNNLTVASAIVAFSASSTGTYTVNTMDTDFTATTGSMAITLSKGAYILVSDATGAIVITCADTGVNSMYLALVMPNGKRVLSDEIVLA